MLGKNFRQPLVTVRRLVDAGPAQLDPRFTHPAIHHFLRYLRSRVHSPVLSRLPLASIRPITRPAPWTVEYSE